MPPEMMSAESNGSSIQTKTSGGGSLGTRTGTTFAFIINNQRERSLLWQAEAEGGEGARVCALAG